MICLINFDEDSLVTPLPCDIRHYFHTGCIEQWLVINAMCPLCKTPVTVEEIDRVAQMYKRKLDQHEKCCSEHNSKAGGGRETSSYDSRDLNNSQFKSGSNYYNKTLLGINDINSSFRSRRSVASLYTPQQQRSSSRSDLEMTM